MQNWAGNIAYGTENVRHPDTVEELQAVVAAAAKLRILGTRHSFSTIADSPSLLVSLDRMPAPIEIDRARRQVTVAAQVPHADLCRKLHDAGLALHNLASLPHISVAGAVATATHGSGVRNGNLATAVAALDLMNGKGEIVRIARGDALFDAAVVGLGAFGVVVRLTLDLVPAFEMRQDVHLDLPLAAAIASFDAIMSSAYSVSLFTRWRGDRVDQVWVKRRLDEPEVAAHGPGAHGATAALEAMHPIATISAAPCTAQLGVPGPWHERLPHFRSDATPSAGAELQSEYFVARHDAGAAMTAIAAMQEAIAPHLLVSEIRTVAADALWMSPHHRRDSVGIHFTWKPDWPSVRAVLPEIEARLAPFGARPHWGKLFTLAPGRMGPLYEKLPAFRTALLDFDPAGKFRNGFVDTVLAGT